MMRKEMPRLLRESTWWCGRSRRMVDGKQPRTILIRTSEATVARKGPRPLHIAREARELLHSGRALRRKVRWRDALHAIRLPAPRAFFRPLLTNLCAVYNARLAG